ncbi:S4 domain-containing protein, partial [Methylobacterium platani]|uniref:S4 domain-containing protein n=1 Tax=Methylobacterium platani TaxID=427683 RepID=UPI0024736F07
MSEAEVREGAIPPGEGSERLDRALARLWPDLSRSRLQALIREGQVTLEGAPAGDPSAKVTAGQRVAVTVPAPRPAEPEPEARDLAVAYEDDDLIVIDKPAGLVVHPGAGNDSGTLVNALLAHCGASLSGIGGVARPGVVPPPAALRPPPPPPRPSYGAGWAAPCGGEPLQNFVSAHRPRPRPPPPPADPRHMAE